MDFVGMLLGTSNAIFLENMLAGKGVKQLSPLIYLGEE